MHPSSVALAIPRTGSQRLTNGGETHQCITFAAWQSPEDKTPKRVVIRVDGKLNDFRDEDGNPGFPCGTVRVAYTIGGLNKEVDLDCLTQSALVVWANTVEVTARKDTDRIAALALNSIKPCADQTVAAAISACNCGDTGFADARYLTAVPIDTEGQEQDFAIPIPNGARLVRILNGAAANLTPVVWASKAIFDVNDGFKASSVNGIIDCRAVSGTEGAFTIPANAKYLLLVTSGNIGNLTTPAFIEWIMAPASLTVQTL